MTRAIALLLVVASVPALAQSKKYPKKPVDEDRMREGHSDLWDAATHPTKGPYKEAIDEARVKLDQRQEDARLAAIEILDRAIQMSPDEPTAYQWRGKAYLDSHDWSKCATDYAAAVEHTKREAALSPDVKQNLGICQARAGKLAEAERTLADAAAQSPRSALLWWRLGETRIALGKLDEARAALDTAIDLSEGTAQAGPLWLRAVAYDRARQPSQAEEDVRRALGFDHGRSLIDNPIYPLLGAGEREYMDALSHIDSDPREVEEAELYFQRFVRVAPSSPWRKRAEEHLRDLHALELPLTVRRLSGAVQFDADGAAKAVRAQMPAMRQCLAKLPGVMLEVQLTRVGPRTPENSPDRPRVRPPPEDTKATAKLQFDATAAEVDDAARCVTPIAEKIAMPPLKDRDSWVISAFYVIAP